MALSDYDTSAFAFVAVVGLLVLLFITCVGLSIFLCLQIKKDDRTAARRQQVLPVDAQATREAKQREMLKSLLDKQYKRSSKTCNKSRNTVRPHTRSNISRDSPCAICLEKFSRDPLHEKIGLLKHCGHFYHFDCIWPWLKQQGNCPVCRKTVQMSDDEIQAVCFSEILTNKSLTIGIYKAGLAGAGSHAIVPVPSLPPQESLRAGGVATIHRPISHQSLNVHLASIDDEQNVPGSMMTSHV